MNDRRTSSKSDAAVEAAAGPGILARAKGAAASTSTNWAGNVLFHPTTVARPRTIGELSALVRSSEKIRVVGSRHSFNEIAATYGTWLDLTSLEVPMTIHSERAVEVPAAMKLCEVNERLAHRGLALASIGEIDQQQIGGLIATGTHGSGLKWGTMSDMVSAMKIVNGQGELVEVSGGAELAAARTHLGALGVVVTVTLQTCLAHNLERRRTMMPIEEALDPHFMAQHDHAQLFYFPFTAGMFVRTLNRTDRAASSGLKLSLGRYVESFKENCGVDLLFALYRAKRNPARIPGLMQLIKDQLKESTDVASSFIQMTSVRTLKYHELEMALDLAKLPAAFAEVRGIIESMAKLEPPYTRFYAHLPVTIRAVKGSENNLMSPSLGRDTAYLSVTSRTDFNGYDRYFDAVEKALISGFAARPHWGKRQEINPAALYPRADAFRAVCELFDPEGKFRNEFIESRLFRSMAVQRPQLPSPMID